MTDLGRATHAAAQFILPPRKLLRARDCAAFVIEVVLLDPSEEAVEAAAQAWLDADEPSLVTPVPSELRSMRAALRAAGMRMLGRGAE